MEEEEGYILCTWVLWEDDTAFVPMLSTWLFEYGDKRWAEDYLNCGHPKLADDGREWAHNHGYRISTFHLPPLPYGEVDRTWSKKRKKHPQ